MLDGPIFPLLFSPLTIGAVTLKNRIVSSGHDTVMAEDGHVTDRLVAYQEARAAGGAGLIVVQVAGVHESARYTSHVLMATDDSCTSGYRTLAETIHRYGCAVFGQLFHPGREIIESQDGSIPVALAPSAVPKEAIDACRALDADGDLDYVSVVSGSSATLASSIHIVPPMSEPSAYVVPLSARIKAVVSVPVWLPGGSISRRKPSGPSLWDRRTRAS